MTNLRSVELKNLKLRWINGYDGDEYAYYIENKLTGERTYLDPEFMDKFLSENKVTLNDFRNIRTTEMMEKLIKAIPYVEEKYKPTAKAGFRPVQLENCVVVTKIDDANLPIEAVRRGITYHYANFKVSAGGIIVTLVDDEHHQLYIKKSEVLKAIADSKKVDKKKSRLAELRKARGFSQIELAKKIGIGEATLQRYELNDYELLKATYATVLKLARFLEVEPSDFVNDRTMYTVTEQLFTTHGGDLEPVTMVYNVEHFFDSASAEQEYNSRCSHYDEASQLDWKNSNSYKGDALVISIEKCYLSEDNEQTNITTVKDTIFEA